VDDKSQDRDIDALIDRLRAVQKRSPSEKPALPKKPTAEEVFVEQSDAHHPHGFGQKLALPGLCNSEGWYWSWDPRAGHYPISVWCGRPTGHAGSHQARDGFNIHRHKVKVFQWNDDAPEHPAHS
jgi:hypothetical protein